MDTSAVIAYQPYDGTDGLHLADGVLHAHKDGVLLASAPAPAGLTLPELLADYHAPGLLPGLRFAWAAPARYDITVTVSPVSLPGEISGTMTINDTEHAWHAIHGKHPDFARHDELPAGARPWAAAGPYGWELLLPLSLLQTPDPVLVQRVACAIEAYVHAIADGQDVPSPYRRILTNTFAADAPAWRANLPRVIPPAERHAYL